MNHFQTTFLLFFSVCLCASAQEQGQTETYQGYEWMNVHRSYLWSQWTMPVRIDSIEHARIADGNTTLEIVTHDGQTLPLTISNIDSLTFTMPNATETKDPYQVFQMYIYTRDGEGVNTRDYYIPCYVALNASGSYSDQFLSAGIRGRGNSTWLWYDKKPFRLKLDKKHKLLGLDKAKSWVLLANYRDVTDVMNTYVFELGRMMGLPYTNHSRYVELFLDGNYQGLYLLTEQVQQGSSRVDVSDDRGILLTLDVDDGPAEEPSATNNFWTAGFSMPAAVKYPDEERLTAQQRDSIRDVFAQLEDAIKRQDFDAASAQMDMASFARYLIIQELVYNVELSAPRSIFLHKDGDQPWVMGPLWDFDAGYDFDWSNMYTGHNYFSDYRETVMGSNPVKRNGNYPSTPRFFTNLFGCHEFVKLYKDTWHQYADSIVSRPWAETQRYLSHLQQDGAAARDLGQWPVRGKSFDTEVRKMHEWLLNRAAFLGALIEAIPDPAGTQPIVDEQVVGSLDVDVTLYYDQGYDQDAKVEIPRSEVLRQLGIDDKDFDASLAIILPLNTDGTPGENNTNGVFGGWFDADGNPRVWGSGHVYIEVYKDLFHWTCGLHQGNCYDDEHTVTMQFQYPVATELRKINIHVHFTIEDGNQWWWW